MNNEQINYFAVYYDELFYKILKSNILIDKLLINVDKEETLKNEERKKNNLLFNKLIFKDNIINEKNVITEKSLNNVYKDENIENFHLKNTHNIKDITNTQCNTINKTLYNDININYNSLNNSIKKNENNINLIDTSEMDSLECYISKDISNLNDSIINKCNENMNYFSDKNTKDVFINISKNISNLFDIYDEIAIYEKEVILKNPNNRNKIKIPFNFDEFDQNVNSMKEIDNNYYNFLKQNGKKKEKENESHQENEKSIDIEIKKYENINKIKINNINKINKNTESKFNIKKDIKKEKKMDKIQNKNQIKQFSFWKIENESYITKPLYIQNTHQKYFTLLHESEEMIKNYAHNKHSIKFVPRHLLYVISQIISRIFFDPLYRRHLFY